MSEAKWFKQQEADDKEKEKKETTRVSFDIF